MLAKPKAKFSIGDVVIADGDLAKIYQIIPPADSDMFAGVFSYGVKWDNDEWGTFSEDELEFKSGNI